MKNIINKQIKHSIQTNNRDILSNICINELELLLTKVEFIQDRQMLQSMINGVQRQIGTDIPLKLSPVCDIIGCKDYNYCNTCYNK